MTARRMMPVVVGVVNQDDVVVDAHISPAAGRALIEDLKAITDPLANLRKQIADFRARMAGESDAAAKARIEQLQAFSAICGSRPRRWTPTEYRRRRRRGRST